MMMAMYASLKTKKEKNKNKQHMQKIHMQRMQSILNCPSYKINAEESLMTSLLEIDKHPSVSTMVVSMADMFRPKKRKREA